MKTFALLKCYYPPPGRCNLYRLLLLMMLLLLLVTKSCIITPSQRALFKNSPAGDLSPTHMVKHNATCPASRALPPARQPRSSRRIVGSRPSAADPSVASAGHTVEGGAEAETNGWQRVTCDVRACEGRCRAVCVRVGYAVLCLLICCVLCVPCPAMRLTCLAVFIGACVFPLSFEPTRFMPCDRVGSGPASLSLCPRRNVWSEALHPCGRRRPDVLLSGI